MQKTVDWDRGQVVMIDQTRLPGELVTIRLRDYREVAEAIRTMKVRGAPAIGVTAALGMALGACSFSASTARADFDRGMVEVGRELDGTRPTAVNLMWATARILAILCQHPDWSTSRCQEAIRELAISMIDEDIALNRALGFHGAALVPNKATLLTHCNAGALACAGFGTALGVVRAAVEQGKEVQVIADETRPRLQGAQLTAWELQQDGIPVTVIPDNAAGSLMRQGVIDLVVVGADRIAANGDVANKIGTYQVAVLAKENDVPFYVAAPISTVDFCTLSGEGIPIEYRQDTEVKFIQGVAITPVNAHAMNPAFDVTPARYVRGIITERGIAYPPFNESLLELAGQ